MANPVRHKDYSITIRSETPLQVIYNQDEEKEAVHLAAAPAFNAHAAQPVPAAAQMPRQDGSIRLSKKEIFALMAIAPSYYVCDYILKAGALETDPRVLAGVAIAGTVGAAAVYSPKVRNGLAFGARAAAATVRGVWNWGIVAPFNGLRNHGRAIGGGLLTLGASGFNLTRRALSAVGRTSTALVAGTVRVGATALAEAGRSVSTLIESTGNIIPELTGMAVTAAATYYLGIPYLMQNQAALVPAGVLNGD